jgi:hypothetical protein
VAAYLPTYTGNLPNLTGPVTTTGNLTGSNILTSGLISAAGIITGGNVSTGNITAGNISTIGNVQAAYFLGDGSQLTNLPVGNYSNANVANYLPTYTGNLASLTGPVITTSNITGGNLQTGGSLTVSGNVVGGNVSTGNVIAGNVSTVGNVQAAYFLGDGSQLTNLPAGNYSNANVANYLPTYTGNLASLTGPVTTTGNLTGSNILTAGLISATGNITGGNVSTGNILAGNVSIAGNVSGTYILGDGSQLTNLPAGNYSNANVAAYLPTYTGNLVSLTGPVTTTANITGGNITTAGSITATGNITGGNIATGNVVAANVESLGTVSAVGNVTGTYFIGNGAFLTGIASGNNNYSNANVAAYLPTYTGNLVSLTGPVITTGNITGGNVSTVGNVTANNLIANSRIKIGLANIYTTNFDPAVLQIQSEVVEFSGQIIAISDISGNNISAGGNVTGSNIYTNGIVSATGNIYAANFVGNVAGNITVPGATTQILFNDGGLAGANAGLTFNKATQVLSVTGNIQGGNLRTAGLISATGNIAGQYFVGNGALLTGIVATAGAAITNGNSNVVVSGNGNITVSVTGVANVTTFATTGVYVAGVVLATGNVTGNYIIGNGALLTGLAATYGNANVANYLPTYSGNLPSLTGLVSTTGNISGNYILGNGSLLTGIDATSIQNGTSNVRVVSSGGNVTIGVGGTGNVAVFATTGAYIAGEISATGNIAGNYFIGNGSQLTGVAASSVNANALIGNTLSANVLYSSLTTVGNLANLSVVGNTISGNLLTSGLISATGNITGSNLNITGGTLAFANANIIQTNPLDLAITGNYQISIKPAGGSYQWTFNNDGSLSGPTGLSTTGYVTATGNITGGNLSTSGLITASGNISGNNIFATTLISVPGNVIAGNVNTSAIRPTSGELTITTAAGNLNLQPAGNIVLANTYINSVAYPQQDTDAATKLYVDNMVSTGIAYHTPVSAATTTDLATATSGTITYAQPNGAANGIGATLTTTGSFNLIDTANVQTIGTRILVQNEGNTVFNGVYTWANATVIVRATDADQYGPDSTEAMSINDYFFVQNGTVNKGAAFVVSAPAGTITFGTSGITFSQFSSSQTYTANTNAGISLIGTQFNTKVDNDTTAFDAGGNIIVKAGANLTTPNIGAATGTSLSLTGNAISGNVLTGGLISATGNITGGNITTAGSITTTGNISGNYFLGNGSQLTGVIAAGGQGNTITLGTPTDGNLVANGAYQGWTTATFVTDGLDDLNQVAFNIANSTYVGNTYITANVYSGPSPLSVSFTGRYIGNPNSYLWQFGDGTANVTTANAIHTFSNALGGTFTVSFTAYNTNGTFNGNAANGAKGSTSTASISNIVLYTPSPIPSFTLSSNSFNSGNSVTVTNTSQYVTWYDLSFGDGTANFTAGPGLGNTSFTTVNHTYNSVAANTDSLYSVILSGTSNTAGPSNVVVVSSASNVKSFSSQASNVSVTANVTTVINGLGVVSFRNDSNGAPGNTASFGSQQLYNYNYGDGNVSNVNIGTGIAGNPSAANVTNTFVLSGANQAGNAYQQFTANLFLYTGFSSSPAKSSNITITVNPQVRANFIGATANTTTDATANTGNARVGYIYTDYTGNDRATFTFQNTSQNSNLANWSWGDSTFSNGVSNVGNTLHTYTSTGAKTVALTANGTPNGISSTAQSNTSSITGYIFIATNPTAPTNLSGFSNLAIANTSEGTSPLLAAGARDATGGNIVANGASVTRFAATTTIATAANIVNANTATTGTLSAYVNNNISGNVTFTTNGNTVGSNAALVISADRDLHVANAAVPSYFYKVFNANISCALSSLETGYNNYKLVHTVSGNTNYVGFVKDNLNTAPSLVTSNIAIVEGTAGTYRYISGIPYYNTGSPTVTIANLAVANLSGQTFRSTDPFVLASGTVSEGTGALVSATQTKSLSTINNSGNSFLTGANLNANVGVASNYTLGNMTANLTGANNVVATLQANIFNVIGTSTTVQLPANIQMYAGANSGVNEQSITASTTGNTQAAIRVVMSTAGNTPVFSNSTNFYTANAWSGAQTIAGTPEAVVRYGVLKQYAVDLSTGYLPVGPNLSVAGGRTSTQYFTFAFARPSLANFDIRITSATGVAGVWIAAPGTTIDKSGFTSPTPGFPGPTSTINGWLEASTQYAGSGVPGASGTGGNGSNGCALTGADVIPLNTAISNVAYTMTLGSQNAANSTGTNILIRIALSSGQTISDLQIGTAT